MYRMSCEIKNVTVGRRWNVAPQERKIFEMEIEIVTLVVDRFNAKPVKSINKSISCKQTFLNSAIGVVLHIIFIFYCFGYPSTSLTTPIE